MQWCVGMYSSGSTWVVHTIHAMGSTLFPNKTHSSTFVEFADQVPPRSPNDWLIIKSHLTDETTTQLLLSRAVCIWVSIRDPRDSVASIMTYMNEGFESALHYVALTAMQCEQLVTDQRCRLLRYEDGFIDDPATLDRFASGFGRSLPARERERLFQQTRRKAIEAMIQGFDVSETVDDGIEGHRVHLATHWHTHHVNRTGEVGRWRHTLDREQAAAVERRLGSWMEQFGYIA